MKHTVWFVRRGLILPNNASDLCKQIWCMCCFVYRVGKREPITSGHWRSNVRCEQGHRVSNKWLHPQGWGRIKWEQLRSNNQRLNSFPFKKHLPNISTSQHRILDTCGEKKKKTKTKQRSHDSYIINASARCHSSKNKTYRNDLIKVKLVELALKQVT